MAAVVVQIVADKDGPASLNPTKPVGGSYTAEEVLEVVRESPKLYMKEDVGKGYRQMVTSPKPMNTAK